MYTLANMSNHQDESGYFKIKPQNAVDATPNSKRSMESEPSACEKRPTMNKPATGVGTYATTIVPPPNKGTCMKDKMLILFIILLIGMMMYRILD